MRKFHYSKLSEIECAHKGCDHKIKANLVVRKDLGTVLYCYKHYLMRKNNSNKGKTTS